VIPRKSSTFNCERNMRSPAVWKAHVVSDIPRAVLLVLFRPDLTQTSSAQVKAVTLFGVYVVTCKPGGGVMHGMLGAENLFFFAVLSKLNSGYRFCSPGSLSWYAAGVRMLPCCFLCNIQ
jgi:hypothetical protein